MEKRLGPDGTPRGEKVTKEPVFRDYTVGGPEGVRAQEKGLASGNWFVPYVERKTMRRTLTRCRYSPRS